MKLENKLLFIETIFLLIICSNIYSDSYENNFYNNHGIVGLINTPTARFFDESVHGATLYNGSPDQKVTLTANPYGWMEASFFYTNIDNKNYCNVLSDPVCNQDYKDKGFNIKLKLKKEGALPAIAVGFMDFAGTGLYSSEYIVSSYGIGNIDMHLGLSWGQLNGFKEIVNPFTYIKDSFTNRPTDYVNEGGAFNVDKYFSGEKASVFYGISYRLQKNLFLSLEKDPTNTDKLSIINYPDKKSNFSYGINYNLNKNFSIGTSFERGKIFSVKFLYKNNPKKSKKNYEFKKGNINKEDNKYTKLIKNLEENGIGVNKITETPRSLGLELTQFIHTDIALVEEIIKESSRDAGIDKNIKKDIKIADLDAVSEIDAAFIRNSNIIYQRDTKRSFNTKTGLRFQPFLASREEFFKGAFLVENNSEIVLKKNLFFNINLKYSLANNFNDLRYPPVDTFPAQVRSDVKQYLKNMDKGVLIGRAQLDYHYSHKKDHHFMLTGGILEDMFSGYGAEYLYFSPNTNYSFGFEIFNVKKRDYNWGFDHLDYKNLVFNANFYYRNYGLIPFDMKISAGEYLAGDKGSTIEFSRSFKSGVRFGMFATFTDVSSKEFGEGSFDKGIFFNIPIYGNSIKYTWRPLTKDPGAKLVRRNSLHDLLVRFKPID